MAIRFPNLRRYFTDPFGRKDRNYYEKLSVEEKRKDYKCGNRYKTLDQITPWSEWRLKQKFCSEKQLLSVVNQELNKKVSIWQGDITHLEIDAIVNAANSSLLGGGGVDGAIHSAAGWSLRDECAELSGCEAGNAKLTSGHRLPAKYILHTVGPMDENKDVLKSCYETCLQLIDKHNIKSVAFCCVATGVYGYPNEHAAHVALETVRSWLESENHHEKIERIIFCVFLDIDYKIYQRLMQLYFPRDQEVPSVEMLQKRLDSLREMPNVVEDDTNPTEENKSNKQSPMETQENMQSLSDVLKITPSSQENSVDSTQQDVSEPQLVDLDHDDDQHPNDEKSLSRDNQNVDVPFTKEDDTPPSGDGKIPKDKEEKVNTLFSEKDQENDALSLEKGQKDDTPSAEMTQKVDLPPSKSPNNVQPQDPSSLNDDDQINQLSSQKDDHQTDGTLPPEEIKNDGTPPPPASPNNIQPQDPSSQNDDDQINQKEDHQTDDTLPPEETKNDGTPPPLASPRDNEEMVSTQDIEQSSPMDTSSAEQSLKPLDDRKHHSSEGDDQLPVLHRSVTGPAT